MKKIFLMAVLVLSSVATYAQHAVGSLTVQPRIGVNIANLTKSEGADSRIGLVAGAELEYQVSDIFSLSGGALYSQQGCKWSEDGFSATTKLDYINIPILANVYVVKNLAVKVGIQPGFNVNTSIPGEHTFGKKDLVDAKSFDFSIPVGLSYEFSNVVLDARYNFGVTKVFDGSDNCNSVFQIALGYKFSL